MIITCYAKVSQKVAKLYIEGQPKIGTNNRKMADLFSYTPPFFQKKEEPMIAKYQAFPDLTNEEYESLKSSILEHGVLVPVIVSEDDEIIDGHHRVRIAKELGVEYTTEIRSGLTDQEKYELSMKLNFARRHLTLKQKQEIIKKQLINNTESSDRMIARSLGVSPSSVGKVRKKLESEGQLSKLDSSICADGKKRPRKVKKTKRIIEPMDKSHKENPNKNVLSEKYEQQQPDLPLDEVTISNESEKNVELPINNIEPSEEPEILYGDRKMLLKDFKPNSFNCIMITAVDSNDPSLTNEEISNTCTNLLNPGGTLIVFAEQLDLNIIITEFRYSGNLKYIWTFAFLHSSLRCAKHNIKSFWQPVLFFKKGQNNIKNFQNDIIINPEDLIKFFSSQGDVILDPFYNKNKLPGIATKLNRKFIGIYDQVVEEKAA